MTLQPADLDRLEQLAREATPGVSHLPVTAPSKCPDCAFEAALSPAVVSELVAAARLGAAWQDAEGALPAWIDHQKVKEPEGDWEGAEQDYSIRVEGNEPGYWAWLVDNSQTVLAGTIEVDGPTPAAALAALAEALRRRP